MHTEHLQVPDHQHPGNWDPIILFPSRKPAFLQTYNLRKSLFWDKSSEELLFTDIGSIGWRKWLTAWNQMMAESTGCWAENNKQRLETRLDITFKAVHLMTYLCQEGFNCKDCTATQRSLTSQEAKIWYTSLWRISHVQILKVYHDIAEIRLPKQTS